MPLFNQINMKKRFCQNPLVQAHSFLALIAFIFVTHFASAQKLENSLLWKIEGNGIEQSYLFGTIHVLPQADFEMKPKVAEAFNECKNLVLELDLSKPGLQEEMMKYSLMTDGTTIDKLLSKEDYEGLGVMLKETTGISIEMVNSFKPFVISTLLLSRYIDGQPASFELSLIQMAGQAEIRILALETVESQLKI
jgi:uncharacterized protein YbaP (TraB family)